MASYNGGPGRVKRALTRSRKNDFWQLTSTTKFLPRETRDYVPMILAAVIIARNPAQYGFDFEPEAPIAYETVTLARPVDLRRVAEWADSSISDLQLLNPELRRWTTPIGEPAYQLKVPMGTGAQVELAVASASNQELASFNYYIVKKGETLATVSRRLRVSRTDLAEANSMKVTSRLSPGQKLMVPREATVLMASRNALPVPVADSRPLTADRVVAASDIPESTRVKVTYQVKRGDTLASIARVFSTTVSSIKTWNRLPSTDIRYGQKLTIYTARAN
jgi:membrane-bound lytic murein transglycosylase D